MRDARMGRLGRAVGFALAFALALLAGCAGTPAAFAPKYPDNDRAAIAALVQRAQSAPQRPRSSIAVGVTAPPHKLFAFDLSARRTLWQVPVEPSSAPHVAGNSVVLQSEDAIVGYDLKTGVRRFSLDSEEMVLKGADGEGPLVAITIGQGSGTFAKSEAILVRDGSEQWRRPLDALIGVPAVVGNSVLVPWSGQFLSAIDAASGEEYARVRVRDGVISHALRVGPEVYLGSFHGIARLSGALDAGALKAAGLFTLPEGDLPGRPLLLRDVFTETAPQAADSAQHRIALGFRPALDGARVALQDDALYLVFYRFVFALSPADLTVRWVYVHDRDLVGASGQPNGIAFADEAGRIAFVASGSGQRVWQEQAVAGASVVQLPDEGSGVDAGGDGPTPEGLAAMLLGAAQDNDARLVPARLLAVSTIAKLPQADATANLIELCDSERISPPVRERACGELKQRTVGADHLLAALERHAAFLEGTTTPPVGYLAKAVAALGEKRAVAPLVAHLADPETRSSDLPALVTALGELGEASAAEPLAKFLRTYHADAIDEHVVRALELVPGVLLKLSGPVARPTLQTVTDDGLGVNSVRLKAQAALDTLVAQQAAAEKSDEARAEQQAEQAVEETATEAAEQEEPTHLSTALISQALLPVRDPLKACLANAAKPTFQARVVIVIEETKPKMVSVLPAELQACVEPLVMSQTFPRTKLPKAERVTHIIKR